MPNQKIPTFSQLSVRIPLTIFFAMGLAAIVALLLIEGLSSKLLDRIFDEQALLLEQQSEKLISELIDEQARSIDGQFSAAGRFLLAVAKSTEALYAATAMGEIDQELIPTERQENSLLGNRGTGPLAIAFWGASELTNRAEKDLAVISKLNHLLPEIRKSNSNFNAAWMITASGLAAYTPNINVAAMLPPPGEFDLRNFEDDPPFSLSGPKWNPTRQYVFSDPYMDAAGNGLTLSIVAPIYSPTGDHAASIGIDVTLSTIRNEIMRYHERFRVTPLTDDLGFAFLLDRDGHIVAIDPENLAKLAIHKTSTDTHKVNLFERRPDLETLFNGFTDQVGMFDIDLHSTPHKLAIARMPSTGWFFVATFPNDILLDSLRNLSEQAENAQDNFVMEFWVAFGVILFLAMLVIIFELRRQITNPLMRLTNQARNVRGDIEGRHEGEDKILLDSKRSNEIGALARQLVATRHDLLSQQKQLKAQSSKLEQQVSDRTEELKTALEEQKRLYTAVSHEFRTPITVIELALNELNTVDSAKITTDKIRKSLRHLMRLVDQLLLTTATNSKNEQGPQVVHIAELVQNIINSMRDLAEQKEIDIQLTGDPNLACLCEPNHFEHIISNLLSNAIKFSKPGTQVNIVATEMSEQAIIKVVDQGNGIDNADIKRIFLPLERGDQNIQGSGLGLSIARDFARINSGSITVTSELGEGSVFTLHLPKVAAAISEATSQLEVSSSNPEQHNEEQPAVQPSHPPVRIPKDSPNQPTILVVEDNTDLRSSIVDLLSEQYRCLIAEDGEAGMAIAQEHLPDLILSDIMMPKMDGIHMAKALASGEMTEHIPLIFLTAKSERDDVFAGLNHHAVDYITKPFDSEILAVKIQNILRVTQRSASERKSASLENREPPTESIFAAKVRTFCEENFTDQTLNPESLANHMSVSKRQLERLMKATLDSTPAEYIKLMRLSKAHEMLSQGMKTTQVAEAVGFKSVSQFSRAFKEHYGINPSAVCFTPLENIQQ